MHAGAQRGHTFLYPPRPVDARPLRADEEPPHTPYPVVSREVAPGGQLIPNRTSPHPARMPPVSSRRDGVTPTAQQGAEEDPIQCTQAHNEATHSYTPPMPVDAHPLRAAGDPPHTTCPAESSEAALGDQLTPNGTSSCLGRMPPGSGRRPPDRVGRGRGCGPRPGVQASGKAGRPPAPPVPGTGATISPWASPQGVHATGGTGPPHVLSPGGGGACAPRPQHFTLWTLRVGDLPDREGTGNAEGA